MDWRGQFRRGLQVNVGSKYVNGEFYFRKSWGITHLDVLSFGSIVKAAPEVHPDLSRSVYAQSSKGWIYEGFFASATGLPFLGAWTPDHSKTSVYPAWLGRIRDDQRRPLYQGQIGLHYPYGLGSYLDYEKGTVFRGALKKEYDTYQGTMGPYSEEEEEEEEEEDDDGDEGEQEGSKPDGVALLKGQASSSSLLSSSLSLSKRGEKPPTTRSLLYVPVLAGVLSRISSEPIPDDQIIGEKDCLSKNSLPASVLDLEEMYFGGDRVFPPAKEGDTRTASIECRSRAVLNYEKFIQKYRAVTQVWKAVSQGATGLQYSGTTDIQGTGNAMEDFVVLGKDATQMVKTHSKRAKGLRAFLRDTLPKKEKTFANQVLSSSFELLSLSKEYGQEFDAASPYFRRMAARLDSIHEQQQANEVASDEGTALSTAFGRLSLGIEDVQESVPMAASEVCNSDFCRAILEASLHLDPLGPQMFNEFLTVSDFLRALDDLLGYASEMVCLRCFGAVSGKGVKTADEALDAANANMYASLSDDSTARKVAAKRKSDDVTVEISVAQARGFPSVSGSLVAKVTIGEETLSTKNTGKSLGGMQEWEHEVLTFGTTRAPRATSEVRINLVNKKLLGMKSEIVATFTTRLISLISAHKAGANWHTLELSAAEAGRLANDPSRIAGEIPRVKISILISNIPALLADFPQRVFPRGCGLASGIRTLLSGIEDDMLRVENKLATNDDGLACIAATARQDDFGSQECLVQDISDLRPFTKFMRGSKTPRVELEGELRDNIFGGIFTADDESVSMFEDVEEGDGPFFSGPGLFASMLDAVSTE
jgi:hypothetical protein